MEPKAERSLAGDEVSIFDDTLVNIGCAREGVLYTRVRGKLFSGQDAGGV